MEYYLMANTEDQSSPARPKPRVRCVAPLPTLCPEGAVPRRGCASCLGLCKLRPPGPVSQVSVVPTPKSASRRRPVNCPAPVTGRMKVRVSGRFTAEYRCPDRYGRVGALTADEGQAGGVGSPSCRSVPLWMSAAQVARRLHPLVPTFGHHVIGVGGRCVAFPLSRVTSCCERFEGLLSSD